MQRRFFFSQSRFIELPKQQQHKKCAELLRELYQSKDDTLIPTYHQWTAWLKEPSAPLTTEKVIADFYHHHLQEAGIQLKEHSLLPLVRTGDRNKAPPPLPIAVYLDNIRSAHNVGSILRTTEALGIGNIVLSPATPSPNNKKVNDAAMGADKWVEWKRADNLSDLPRPIVALETSPNALPYENFKFPDIFTLAIGNEEYGCSDTTLQQAEIVIEIPMRGRKNSINVANAFAIIAAKIDSQFRQE